MVVAAKALSPHALRAKLLETNAVVGDEVLVNGMQIPLDPEDGTADYQLSDTIHIKQHPTVSWGKWTNNRGGWPTRIRVTINGEVVTIDSRPLYAATCRDVIPP